MPSDLGRRYGVVAGDKNPIHLWPITAKLFGFKRHIIHGMWLLARAVAELDTDVAEGRVQIDVSFKRPVFCPERPPSARERMTVEWPFAWTTPRRARRTSSVRSAHFRPATRRPAWPCGRLDLPGAQRREDLGTVAGVHFGEVLSHRPLDARLSDAHERIRLSLSAMVLGTVEPPMRQSPRRLGFAA